MAFETSPNPPFPISSTIRRCGRGNSHESLKPYNYVIFNLEYCISSVLIGSFHLGYQIMYRFSLYGKFIFLAFCKSDSYCLILVKNHVMLNMSWNLLRFVGCLSPHIERAFVEQWKSVNVSTFFRALQISTSVYMALSTLVRFPSKPHTFRCV